jgi:flagellar basal body-associated protein FliL
MADTLSKDPKKDAAAEEAAPPRKSKKGLVLGGGIASLVGLAYLTFLMAVPKVDDAHELRGPFVAELTASEVSVTLSGNDGRNFLGIQIRAEFNAYEEIYVAKRTVDPLYQAMLDHRSLTLLSGKTKADLEGTTGMEVLCEELRTAIDPILFPVHVGATNAPTERDEKSGLRVGRSADRATWRGLFHDHVLHVDAPDRTIALDGGEKVPFHPGDDDVRLLSPTGDTLYVDVTSLLEDFVGEVQVGAMGKIRRIYFFKFISQ